MKADDGLFASNWQKRKTNTNTKEGSLCQIQIQTVLIVAPWKMLLAGTA